MEAIFEMISKFLSTFEGLSATLAVGLEIVFRLIKTEKPLSILYGVAFFFKKAGEIFTKFGQLLDKVLPQRLK